MSKLDELKALVAGMVEKATTEDEIKQTTLLDNKMKEVATEFQELQNEQKDLLKDYKELYRSIPTVNPKDVNIETEPKQVSFEDALAAFMANSK